MTSTTHSCHAISSDGSGCDKPGLHKYPLSTDVWFCLTHLNYERRTGRPVRPCDVGKQDNIGDSSPDCQVRATHPVDYWPGRWACKAHYVRYWSSTVPAKRDNHFEWLATKENVERGRLWMEQMSREHGWILDDAVVDGWPTWKAVGKLKKKRTTKKQPQKEAEWPEDTTSDNEEKKD